MPPVKQEDSDDDIEFTGLRYVERPLNPDEPLEVKVGVAKRAKERVFLEAVVLTPYRELQLQREKAQKELLSKIKNVKKEGMGLSSRILYDRIKKMHCPLYEVPLPQDIRDTTVTRAFISSIYGGNPQETLPRMGKKFLAQHGLDDFMFPSLDYNPEAAQIPGAPGLFFGAGEPAQEWAPIQRVITRINSGAWLYVGQYSFTPTESLTLEELYDQPARFHTTWSREICVKGWGQDIIRRVAARKRFRCTRPTKEQLEIIEASGEYRDVTPEEVQAAFLKGDEVFGVWEMRCVDYDVDFQLDLAEKFKTWVPPPRKPRKPKKEKESQDPKPKSNKKVKIGKKRQRTEASEMSSIDSDVVLLDDDDNDV
ncbi:hypothetical protein AN958_07151 [Leucoagaricus sp. SymC.cos]|nr:hypothetical protein AN958_07151 [Leucoagaricus sp. SymC.cos]